MVITETWKDGEREGITIVTGATSESVIANPWRWYSWLRMNAPVAWSRELQGYIVSCYSDVLRVCMDNGNIFSSEALTTRLPNIFNTDDPDHKRYRTQAVRHFTSRYIRSLEPYIRAVAQRLVKQIEQSAEVDLVSAIASPLPKDIICHIMGIPKADAPHFSTWVQSVFEALASGLGYGELSRPASFDGMSELGLYFTALIEQIRRSPGTDLISRLVVDSGDLDEYETLLLIVTLALGGHATTQELISEGLHLGLLRPDIWNKASTSARWRDFSEEVMRLEPPVHAVARVLRAPTTLHGFNLPSGSKIYAYIGSANRDADAFADPDSPSLDRGPSRSLAFGAGPHMCIGSGLAHLEARVVFETLATILPALEIAPGGDAYAQGLGRRALTHLHVRRRKGTTGKRFFPRAHRTATTVKALTQLGRPQPPVSLAREMAEMRGVVLKVGQLLSFVDLLDRSEYASAFTRLQQQAVARPYCEIAPALEDAGVFAAGFSVDKDAVAAASIGQVHRAASIDGHRYALKVQYPDARDTVDADLRNGRTLSRFMTSAARLLNLPLGKVDIEDLMVELNERIYGELDYRQEANRQEEFRLLHIHPDVIIAKVHREFCTDRVLVMDWIDGMTWQDAVNAPEALRNRWGQVIFRFVFGSLYRHGLFNADPHPGNYLFREDGSIGFVDFGCIKEFGHAQVEALLDIDTAMRKLDYDAAQLALEGIGVRAPATAMRIWLDTLYEPLTSPQPFTYNRRFSKALNDSYLGLLNKQDSSRIAMPRGLLFMNRINLGVHSLLSQLEATADWRSELDMILEHR